MNPNHPVLLSLVALEIQSFRGHCRGFGGLQAIPQGVTAKKYDKTGCFFAPEGRSPYGQDSARSAYLVTTSFWILATVLITGSSTLALAQQPSERSALQTQEENNIPSSQIDSPVPKEQQNTQTSSAQPESVVSGDLSNDQVEQIKSILAQKESQQAFTPDEAALLIKWLKKTNIKSETFNQLLGRLLPSLRHYSQELRLDIADILVNYNHLTEAQGLYDQVPYGGRHYRRALLGDARILAKKQSYHEALGFIEEILNNDPKHYDTLFVKGDILEAQKEYLKAIAVYEEIQQYYPGTQAATNLKIRALMDMGANSLALERIEAAEGKVDPVLYERVRGNKAMYRIRWQEPDKAIESIEEEIKRLRSQRDKKIEVAPVSYPPDRNEVIEKTLAEYESLKSLKTSSSARDEAVNRMLDFIETTSPPWGSRAWADPPGIPEDRFSNEMLLRSIEEEMADRARAGGTESEFQYLRSRWDKIVALRLKSEMEEIIREYEEVLKINPRSPPWVREAVADAYLYLHQPEKALSMYEEVLKEQPKDHNTRMAVYYTLVEMERFREAESMINEIDQETPATILERGLKRENWKKADIASAKAWLLMYQGRHAEAEKYLAQLANQAPFNTEIRSAIAHNHLWRGWPRKALKDFKVAHTLEPQHPEAFNGYSLAMNANGQKKAAREFNAQLLQKYPKHQHILATKRFFDIEMMHTVTASASMNREFPGEEEVLFTLRGEQPLHYRDTIYAELLRRETTQTEENDLINRLYLGNIWQWQPTLKWTTAISQEYDTGDDFGWLTEIEYELDDYWTMTAGYDSHTLDIPVRSRNSGVDATQRKVGLRYRASEQFNTAFGYSLRDLTDGNEFISYSWDTDTALTTRADWKTRLATEFNVTKYTKTDVDYFSPGFVYSFLLVPMLEHTWYRRYEKAMVDRLYIGAGQQWQKAFGPGNIGYIRYEQDYKFSETLSWLMGTTYSLRNYDGGDVNNLNFYTTLRKNF